MAHVAKWKQEEVAQLAKMLGEYPVVGVVNMEGIPARQLQKMRTQFRGDVVVKMSKSSLMHHALEKAAKEEKSLEALAQHIKGQPAFIFSKLNPFSLYKLLEKNRTPAPAKPNSVAPKDILVPKGETPFPPGPMLSELQQAGIPTTVAGGKIAIKEDKVVARKGDKIPPKLAAALTRLGIEPLEIGLNLVAVHEKGTIYLADVLHVDEAKTIAEMQAAFRNAIALSLGTGYVTKATAQFAIAKAFREATALALEAGILEKGVVDKLLGKAHLQMLALAAKLKPEALDEELKKKIS